MKTFSIFALLVIVPISSISWAQSISVIGSNSYAADCYDRSVTAVMTQGAGFSDIQLCDKALEAVHLSQRDRLATYINRGILYAALGKFDRAVSDYERAMELDSNIAESYLNRGNLWFLAQRWNEAIGDYNRADELGIRQRHVLFLNRGMAKENYGALEAAEMDYLAALEVVADWAPALEKLDRVQAKRAELIQSE